MRASTCLLLGLAACSGSVSELPEREVDAGVLDDAGVVVDDADAGSTIIDAGTLDAGVDAGAPDAGWPIYVAGLNPSGFASSRDGITWSGLQALDRMDAGVVSGDNAVTDIVFGLGLAVAVGDSGISVSRDGRTWTLVYAPRLHSAVAAFGLGRFVVLSGGEVLTSTDGLHWSVINGTGDATHWHSIAFGPVGGVPQFVAVGDQWEFVTDGGPAIAPHRLKRSFDGLNWDFIAVHRDTPEGAEQIDALMLGNDLVVGLSTRARGGVVYRYDGSNWAQWEKNAVFDDAGVGLVPLSFAFDPRGGSFLIDGSAGPMLAARSRDGRAWSFARATSADAGVHTDFPPVPFYGGMSWTGDRFIAGSPFHVDAWVASSSDGVAWSAYWAPTTADRAFGEPSVIRFGRVAEP